MSSQMPVKEPPKHVKKDEHEQRDEKQIAHDALLADSDDLLDEIDEILEGETEFLARYRQQGGE